jgi:hypothetical protein
VVLPQAWGFEAMGVDWMKIEEASEAIPPAFSEYLARQTMRVTARLNTELSSGGPADNRQQTEQADRRLLK